MCGFAFAASITPGPVNIVALTSGIRHGLNAGLRYVTGATIAFILLLLAAGLGIVALVQAVPAIGLIIKGSGIAFLLFISLNLWRDDRPIEETADLRRTPSMKTGVIMQWLNPKAWVAALAGAGTYGTSAGTSGLFTFAAIYFVICLACLSFWVIMGMYLARALRQRQRMRVFNRTMAATLAGSALYMGLA